jgi:membrane protease YdiL (CAAX protease family)
MVLSRRDRISAVLCGNGLVTSAELFLVTIFQALGALGFPAIFFLFPFSWISLWLRKTGWRDLGLRRPTNWLRTIGIALIVGMVYTAIEIGLIEPLLYQLGVGSEDLSNFDGIRDNILVLGIWIIIGWTIGAFAEEMVYRGYLLNRLADLIGHGRAGWAIGLIGSSAFFAFGHAYLGMAGILLTFLEACVWVGLYLGGKRNLWLPIIGHGTTNTLAFILMYLGLYP